MTHEFWIGAAVTAALLLAEHILLWRCQLPLVARYTLGVIALNIGMMINGAPWLDLWAISAVGGLTVATLHLWRYWRGERPEDISRSVEAGRLAERAREVGDGLPRR